MNKINKSIKKITSLVIAIILILSSGFGIFASKSNASGPGPNIPNNAFEIGLEKKSGSDYWLNIHNNTEYNFDYVVGSTYIPGEISLDGEEKSYNWSAGELYSGEAKYLSANGTTLSLALKDLKVVGSSSRVVDGSNKFTYITTVNYAGNNYDIVTTVSASLLLEVDLENSLDENLDDDAIDYLKEKAFEEGDKEEDEPSDSHITEEIDEEKEEPVNDNFQRLGQVAENRFLSGYAFDENGEVLSEKKLELIDSYGNVTEVYTDHQGYYQLRLPAGNLKLQGQGFEVDLVNNDNQEVINTNVIGATTLGKLIDSEYGYIHYMPSVVYFDEFDDIEYVVSEDEQYVMVISDRKILSNDVITLPQTSRFVNGITYKVDDVEEANGIQFLKVSDAKITELVNKMDVNTGDEGYSYADMKVYAEDGVVVARKDDLSNRTSYGFGPASMLTIPSPASLMPIYFDQDFEESNDISFLLGLSYDGKRLNINPALTAAFGIRYDLYNKKLVDTEFNLFGAKDAKFKVNRENYRLIEQLEADDFNSNNPNIVRTKNLILDDIIELNMPTIYPNQLPEKFEVNLTRGTASYGGFVKTLKADTSDSYNLKEIIDEFTPAYDDWLTENIKERKGEGEDSKTVEWMNNQYEAIKAFKEAMEEGKPNPTSALYALKVNAFLQDEKEAYDNIAELAKKYPELKGNIKKIFDKDKTLKSRLGSLLDVIPRYDKDDTDSKKDGSIAKKLEKLDDAIDTIKGLELTYMYGLSGKTNLNFVLDRLYPFSDVDGVYLNYDSTTDNTIMLDGAIDLEYVDKDPINIATLVPPHPVLGKVMKLDLGLKLEVRDGKVVAKYVYNQNSSKGFEFDSKKLMDYIEGDEKIAKDGSNAQSSAKKLSVEGHLDSDVGINATPVAGINGLLVGELPTDLYADMLIDFMISSSDSKKTNSYIKNDVKQEGKTEVTGKIDAVLDSSFELSILDAIFDISDDDDALIGSVLEDGNNLLSKINKPLPLINVSKRIWENYPEDEEDFVIQDPSTSTIPSLPYTNNHYHDVLISDSKYNLWYGDKRFTEYTEDEIKAKNEEKYGSQGIGVETILKGNAVYDRVDIRSLFANNNINDPNSDKLYRSNTISPYYPEGMDYVDIYKDHKTLINYYPVVKNFRTTTVTAGDRVEIKNIYKDDKNAARIERVYNIPSGFDKPTNDFILKGETTDDMVGLHEIYVLRKEMLRGFDEVTDVEKEYEHKGKLIPVYDVEQENMYFDKFIIEVLARQEDTNETNGDTDNNETKVDEIDLEETEISHDEELPVAKESESLDEIVTYAAESSGEDEESEPLEDVSESDDLDIEKDKLDQDLSDESSESDESEKSLDQDLKKSLDEETLSDEAKDELIVDEEIEDLTLDEDLKEDKELEEDEEDESLEEVLVAL